MNASRARDEESTNSQDNRWPSREIYPYLSTIRPKPFQGNDSGRKKFTNTQPNSQSLAFKRPIVSRKDIFQ